MTETRILKAFFCLSMLFLVSSCSPRKTGERLGEQIVLGNAGTATLTNVTMIYGRTTFQTNMLSPGAAANWSCSIRPVPDAVHFSWIVPGGRTNMFSLVLCPSPWYATSKALSDDHADTFKIIFRITSEKQVAWPIFLNRKKAGRHVL